MWAGSSVGIATGYGLDGLGIESRLGARFSAPVQTGPGAHTASCTMGTGSFPGVKSSRGVTVTPHPLLVPWSRKSRAIPLLPLWAVRPVQSLSACTSVHFTLLKQSLRRSNICYLYQMSPASLSANRIARAPLEYKHSNIQALTRTANNMSANRHLLTCLLTYLLTPRSRVLLEKPTGSQLVKKFSTFYGTRRFITAFTSARHLPVS